jgi:hypothetical protein
LSLKDEIARSVRRPTFGEESIEECKSSCLSHHLVDPGGPLVITTNSGLRSPEALVSLRALQAFARVDISIDSRSYTTALTRSARAVFDEIGDGCEVILLGSIATPKYVDVLLNVFDGRLCFPADFVGRGDMSRGGLMLRCARSGEELRYVPVKGATRHGVRPPRLAPLARAATVK